MTESAEPAAVLVDEQFLRQVDESLGAILERVIAEEHQLAEIDEQAPEAPSIWQEIMGRLNDRLDGWQARLEAVAGEVRNVESDLRQHQEALRDWTTQLKSLQSAGRVAAPLEGSGPTG